MTASWQNGEWNVPGQPLNRQRNPSASGNSNVPDAGELCITNLSPAGGYDLLLWMAVRFIGIRVLGEIEGG